VALARTASRAISEDAGEEVEDVVVGGRTVEIDFLAISTAIFETGGTIEDHCHHFAMTGDTTEIGTTETDRSETGVIAFVVVAR